jgi:D-alanine--poly(phosphoribitol) ligase subunit 2
MTDVGTRLRNFIATEVLLEESPDRLTDQTQLVGGVMDSLGLMQLVSFIQEEFGVSFEDTEVTPDNFRTVADVERLVSRKLQAA